MALIEELVRQVRQRIHGKIQRSYGTMQLLNIARPIAFGKLYVDVNVLSEPRSYSRVGFLQTRSRNVIPKPKSSTKLSVFLQDFAFKNDLLL